MPQHEPSNQSQPSRRGFMIGSAAITAAGFATFGDVDSLFAEATSDSLPTAKTPLIGMNEIVLFQGDSITDAGRSREAAKDPNSFSAMGKGYAWMAASQLLVDSPDAGLQIFNRGISGDKVFQLADRWQADCLDIKPNVLSILVGVNDFAHVFKHGYDGTIEKYESDYHALIQRTKEALPNVKLILCEPFILKVGLVDESWVPGFAEYRAAAKRVAEKAQAVFVPYQEMFDRAVKFAPPEVWAADGVHPSTFGAALMARWWLKAVGA
ncbi:MAG: SGNH/GDSL hydrolase family protein [Planctomycetes bacterium]|nr:SGNH/GDSL hydrolase family protein [Planctomycetota bacterium]